MGIRSHDSTRRRLTLDQLEKLKSDDPGAGDTNLITRCLQLRKKPIGEYSVEDLRIMIGQNIGLLFLIPLALEQLSVNPLIEGDLYPGDLLCSVLRANPDFWSRQLRLRAQLEDIISKMNVELDAHLTDAINQFCK